jgi:phage terminase small subunit
VIKKPASLDPEAGRFWDRHSKRLKAEGLLTDATYDSFVLLCRTYSHLSRLDPEADPRTGIIKYVAMTRVYQQLAKGFGMHSDKPKAPTSAEEPDEFGIA